MKRYNIHLDPEWMKALDNILKKIEKNEDHHFQLWNLNRSELIRFAIGYCFNLKGEYSRHDDKYLGKAIEKVIKRGADQEGV